MKNDKKTRGKTTATQRAAFLEASILTQDGLEDAISLLNARRVALGTTKTERKEAELKRAELILKSTKVHDRLLAFLAGATAVRPPSKDVMTAIKTRAAELDGMIADSVVTSTVVRASTKLLTQYNKTA